MRNPNIIEDDHIYILKKGEARFEWQEKIRQAIYSNKKDHRFIEYKDLKTLKGKFFIYKNYLYEDLRDNLNFNQNGAFISSSVDPYTEEFYDNTDSIQKQLAEYGIPSYRIHASGHATPHDLINFVKEVNPDYLIPIHTEHPEFFEKIFQNSDLKVFISDINTPLVI